MTDIGRKIQQDRPQWLAEQWVVGFLFSHFFRHLTSDGHFRYMWGGILIE